MPKFKILALLVVVIGILMLGGVIRVEINADKLANVPSAIVENINDPAFVETWRINIVKAKRGGEIWMFQDEGKQLELVALYVESDAERLQKLIEDKPDDAANLLPQAKLLDASVADLRDLAANAPVEAVVEHKEKARRALSLAFESFGELNELQEIHSETNEDFQTITQSLSRQLGELELDSSNESQSAVAGATDDKSEERDEPESSDESIELKF